MIYFVDGLEVHHKFITFPDAALGLEWVWIGEDNIFLEVGSELGCDMVH